MSAGQERNLEVQEVMEHFALNRAEVYRRVKDGALKAVKEDRRLRFAFSEVERYEKALAEERDTLRQAVNHWLDQFAVRLKQYDLTEAPDLSGKSDEEKVAELGRRVLLDGILGGAQDLYLDPVHQGARLLYGYAGNRLEKARFEAPLAPQLKAWFRGLAPLPETGEGKIGEALGQQVYEEKSYQFRLTSVPTLLGEHIHLHFFRNYDDGGIEDLGYTREQTRVLRELLTGRPGLLLVAGPADPEVDRHRMALARELGAAGCLVVSLEHRVQYRSEQLVQLDLSREEGAGFEALWHAALGMSPDVVIIDEIRDAGQARALLEGVHSGAVVIARVRAGGGLEALEQLLRFEVEREALARSLLGLIERAVLRRLCPHCRGGRVLQAGEAEELGVAEGVEIGVRDACQVCGDGFLGRRAVFGLWPADESLAAWIRAPEAPPVQSQGGLSLAHAVRQAVLEGEVELAETRLTGVL